MAYTMLSNARLANGSDTALFEGLSYYNALITTFAFNEPGYFGGHSIAAVLSLILPLRRKGNLLLKMPLVLGTIFICQPLQKQIEDLKRTCLHRCPFPECRRQSD